MEQPGSFSYCTVPACLAELVGLGRRQVRASVVWSTGTVTLVTFAFVPVFLGAWGGGADAWEVGALPCR